MLVYSRCNCSSCGELREVASPASVTFEQRRRFSDLSAASDCEFGQPRVRDAGVFQRQVLELRRPGDGAQLVVADRRAGDDQLFEIRQPGSRARSASVTGCSPKLIATTSLASFSFSVAPTAFEPGDAVGDVSRDSRGNGQSHDQEQNGNQSNAVRRVTEKSLAGRMRVYVVRMRNARPARARGEYADARSRLGSVNAQ